MNSPSIRSVIDGDASALHLLATQCPPLDVHTPYTYWVLTHMFADGCFIAEVDGDPVGFVTTVHKGNIAFLWQIGVRETHRGTGLSTRLIDQVVLWARAHNVTAIQMSIDPGNVASTMAFTSFCAANELSMRQIGTLDLTVEADPTFAENEDIFEIDLT